MLNAFEFAAAVAAAVAAITGSPDPVPPSADVPVIVQDVYTEEGRVAEAGGYVSEDEEIGSVWSAGWITSPYTGRTVCVTAAPCEQDPQFLGAESSSYNWVTGEVN